MFGIVTNSWLWIWTFEWL